MATALAERMGGAAPVAMICLDPQVLEYGRELIDKKESAGRISLRQALEDILQGQGKDSKLRIEEGEPFPMVRLVREDAGAPHEFDPVSAEVNEGSAPSLLGKRSWSRWQEEEQPEAPLSIPRNTRRRAPSVSLTKTSDDWSWRGSKKWEWDSSTDWSLSHKKNDEDYKDWSSWDKDYYDYDYGNFGRGKWSKSKHRSGSSWSEKEETVASSSAPAQATANGVMLYVVDGVPIVSVGKGTDFESNAAPLLQAILQAHSKAECLYENCDKLPEAKRIAKEAKERKIVSARAEVSFVRPRGSESPIAGGLQGKRSLMLALVFALSKQRSCFDRCVTFLRTYSLDDDFKRLMADSGLSD